MGWHASVEDCRKPDSAVVGKGYILEKSSSCERPNV